MGAMLGIHADHHEISELYDRSMLLPLIGSDQRDKVIRNARLKKAHEHQAIPHQETQVMLIVDGSIDLYKASSKLHTIYVSSHEEVAAPETSLQTAARRARYDVTGAESQADDDALAIRTREVLIYWRGPEDVVCRYSCRSSSDEIILKAAVGDRVEFHGRTRYISISLKYLAAKTGVRKTINAVTNADLVELVGDIPFFTGIPREHLAMLTELSTLRVYPSNSVIFREDEGVSTQMYVTLAGTLEVSSSRASAPLAKLEPGSFFGEMSLLINIPRAATVTTVDSCLLLSIEKPAFHSFLENLPDVKLNVYKLLKERLLFKAMKSGVVPYFSNVPTARLIKFSQDLDIEDHVRKGDCLLDQEDVNSHKFGLIIYGVLEIVSSEQKRAKTHSQSVFITPGCYFGPFTFERLNFQRGKVLARSSVVLLSCPFSRVKELFDEYPEVAAEAHVAWFGERCDLAAVLRHAILTQRFQAFLEAEHSDENFMFCLDVQRFRSTPREERRQLAILIQQRYIQPDSPKEVNLPAVIRDQIVSTLKKTAVTDDVPVTFFDTANDEIMRLMKKDSFPRFKKSPMFQTVVDALDPHLNRKGSKLMDACHAFRESISLVHPGKLEHASMARMQRMLSTIRRSQQRQNAVAATNGPEFRRSRAKLRHVKEQ